MAEQPSEEDTNKWHRWFAIECNNRTWDLASQAERTPEEDREMLHSAYAAAFHWSKVGQPVNDARADMTLAHVNALLGNGDQALHYASRCLAFFQKNPGEDWDLAFAHAEMAFATAAIGDREMHSKHYILATECGAAIKDDADRRVFDEEFARISRNVTVLRKM